MNLKTHPLSCNVCIVDLLNFKVISVNVKYLFKALFERGALLLDLVNLHNEYVMNYRNINYRNSVYYDTDAVNNIKQEKRREK